VPGTARELQADALVALEDAGLRPVLQVHDEIVCEVPEDSGVDVEEVRKIMCTSSPWAAKWPIDGAGYEGKRYKK
jgi:DNA polymerase